MRLTSRQVQVAALVISRATKPVAAAAVAGYRLSIFLHELSQEFARAEKEEMSA